jgi:hypothetical protein
MSRRFVEPQVLKAESKAYDEAFAEISVKIQEMRERDLVKFGERKRNCCR